MEWPNNRAKRGSIWGNAGTEISKRERSVFGKDQVKITALLVI